MLLDGLEMLEVCGGHHICGVAGSGCLVQGRFAVRGKVASIQKIVSELIHCVEILNINGPLLIISR